MAAKDLALKIVLGAQDGASPVLDKTRQSAGLLTDAFKTLVRLAPAIGFGAAIKSAGDFEEAMLRVKAASGASGEEIAQLEAEANRLSGLSTLSYSADQAASGFEVLARAGQSVEEQLGTLGGVMNFAQGQSIELATASGIVTGRLDQFGLKATTAAEATENAARVTDVLAKAATLANTDVLQLGSAMDNINVQAKLNETGLEETAAALDVLAKNGVRGSEAGTYLSGVFEELNNPTSQLSRNLDALGISARDFPTVIQKLAAAGGDAQAVFTGLDDVTRSSLQIFLSGEAPAALADFTAQLQSANGYAASTAETMGKSLSASFGALISTVDAAARQFAKPILDPLKNSLSSLTGVVARLAESGFLEKLGQAFANLAQRAIDAAEAMGSGFDLSLMQARLEEFIADFEVAGTQLIADAENLAQNWSRRWDVLSASATIAIESIDAGFETLRFGVITIKNALEAAFGAIASRLAENGAKVSGIFARLADAVGADGIAADAARATDALRKVSEEYKVGAISDLDELSQAQDSYSEKMTESNRAIADAYKVLSGEAEQSAVVQKQAAENAAESGTEYKRLHDEIVHLLDIYDQWQQAGAPTEDLEALNATINELEGQLNGLEQANTDTAESTEALADAADAAGDAQEKQAAAAKRAAEAQAAATEQQKQMAAAYETLGVTSQAALENIADKSRLAFETLRDGGAPLRDLQAAFSVYAEKAIEANNGVVDAALRSDAVSLGLLDTITALGPTGEESGAQAADGIREIEKASAAAEQSAEQVSDALSDTATQAQSAGISVASFYQSQISRVEAFGRAAQEALWKLTEDYFSFTTAMGGKAGFHLEAHVKRLADQYERQAGSVERLTEKFRDLESATAADLDETERLINGYTLLDDTELAGIRSEIERLRSETQQAAEELSGLAGSIQDELDRMAGNQAAIENRRYQDQVERIREVAKKAGESADEELALARRLHEEKMKMISAEKKAKEVRDSVQSQRTRDDSGAATTRQGETQPVKTVRVILPGKAPIQVVQGDEGALLDLLEEAGARA